MSGEDTSEITVPAYSGECYEAMVPGTSDIQERAELAVNGLTGPTDPEKDYMLILRGNEVVRIEPPGK